MKHKTLTPLLLFTF